MADSVSVSVSESKPRSKPRRRSRRRVYEPGFKGFRRQVHLYLTPHAYSLLSSLSIATGRSYSDVVEDLLLGRFAVALGGCPSASEFYGILRAVLDGVTDAMLRRGSVRGRPYCEGLGRDSAAFYLCAMVSALVESYVVEWADLIDRGAIDTAAMRSVWLPDRGDPRERRALSRFSEKVLSEFDEYFKRLFDEARARCISDTVSDMVRSRLRSALGSGSGSG